MTTRSVSLGRSYAERIAVGAALCDFFGGKLVPNDCADTLVVYEVPAKSDVENAPEDGEEWEDLQTRISFVKPLTEADIARWRKYAVYDGEGGN